MYPQPTGQNQNLMPQYGALGNVPPGQVPQMPQVGVAMPGPHQAMIPPNGRGKCVVLFFWLFVSNNSRNTVLLYLEK